MFVEPLNETAGLSSVERVEDALLPVIQGIEEGVKTMQAGCFALLDPKLQSALDRGAIRNLVKNGAQQGTQHAGVGQSRDLLKQRDDFSWLIRIRRPPFPAHGGFQPVGNRLQERLDGRLQPVRRCAPHPEWRRCPAIVRSRSSWINGLLPCLRSILPQPRSLVSLQTGFMGAAAGLLALPTGIQSDPTTPVACQRGYKRSTFATG